MDIDAGGLGGGDAAALEVEPIVAVDHPTVGIDGTDACSTRIGAVAPDGDAVAVDG